MPTDAPSQPTPPPDRVQGGVSSVIGLVGLVSVAAVSLVVQAEGDALDPSLSEATRALEAAGGPDLPVVMTDPGGEELVWASQGRVALLAPWEARPAADAFVAVSRDPARLPRPRKGEQTGELVVEKPWVARRYGTARPGTGDLMALLPGAEVSVAPQAPGQAARRCEVFKGQRWACGPAAWNHVGPETLTIGGSPQRCLWLHPFDGAELRVSFPGLARGARIEGRAALSDEAAGTSGGAPIRFRAELDGTPLWSRAHANQPGWVPFTVEIPAVDAGPATVTFSTSASRTGRRHFCIQGRVVAGGAP